MFGYETWTPLPVPFSATELPKRMPPDVKKIGSAATLKVFNAGERPKWQKARNAMWWLPSKKKEAAKEEDKQKDMVKGFAKAFPTSSLAAASATKDEAVMASLRESYKPTRHHQKAPQLRKARHNQNQVVVYSSLPFSELEPIPHEMTPPQIVKEIQQLRAEAGQYQDGTPGSARERPKTTREPRRLKTPGGYHPPTSHVKTQSPTSRKTKASPPHSVPS